MPVVGIFGFVRWTPPGLYISHGWQTFKYYLQSQPAQNCIGAIIVQQAIHPTLYKCLIAFILLSYISHRRYIYRYLIFQKVSPHTHSICLALTNWPPDQYHSVDCDYLIIKHNTNFLVSSLNLQYLRKLLWFFFSYNILLMNLLNDPSLCAVSRTNHSAVGGVQSNHSTVEA